LIPYQELREREKGAQLNGLERKTKELASRKKGKLDEKDGLLGNCYLNVSWCCFFRVICVL